MGAAPRVLRVIDGDAVRHRRVALGLSLRLLAGALGVTQQVIHRLEHGMRQNELDVSFIVDLAQVLGCRVEQLLIGHKGSVVQAGDELESGDLQAVGAILAGAATWVYVDDLAAALDWTLERTLVALEALAEVAPVLGQRIAWINDREVALCADVDAEPALSAVTSRAVHTWGLSSSDASLLHIVAMGGRPPTGRAVLITTRRLVRADLMTVDVIKGAKQDDRPRLTDTARYNLCLAELGLDDARIKRRKKPSQRSR